MGGNVDTGTSPAYLFFCREKKTEQSSHNPGYFNTHKCFDNTT